MASQEPTKEEFLEALKKNGINSLEDLVDAIMPETGGFTSTMEMPDNTSGSEREPLSVAMWRHFGPDVPTPRSGGYQPF